jgi:6,7-dimethyl-8-ribityllumazine synthase
MMMKPKDCNFNYPTMSSETQKWTPNSSNDARGLRIAVVVARFNDAITGKLLEGAQKALEGASHIEICYVPGAFELPFAARVLALKGTYDAIVALGCVIRGGTPHFEYVAGESARGLQQVALETGVPVAFGVLTTDDLDQAQARAGGPAGNKGYDAAMTAIEMARFGK